MAGQEGDKNSESPDAGHAWFTNGYFKWGDWWRAERSDKLALKPKHFIFWLVLIFCSMLRHQPARALQWPRTRGRPSQTGPNGHAPNLKSTEINYGCLVSKHCASPLQNQSSDLRHKLRQWMMNWKKHQIGSCWDWSIEIHGCPTPSQQNQHFEYWRHCNYEASLVARKAEVISRQHLGREATPVSQFLLHAMAQFRVRANNNRGKFTSCDAAHHVCALQATRHRCGSW